MTCATTNDLTRADHDCHCGARRTLVLVYALPAVLCDECYELTGAGAAALEVLPFNGWFFTRERGLWGYLSAVWAFLAGEFR